MSVCLMAASFFAPAAVPSFGVFQPRITQRVLLPSAVAVTFDCVGGVSEKKKKRRKRKLPVPYDHAYEAWKKQAIIEAEKEKIKVGVVGVKKGPIKKKKK
jgi:hypothetical protein